MLARIRKAQDDEAGFTLIELLVVVIIIGILAAIAIPTFLNQRKNGWEAQARSDVRNAITNAETFATTNNGSYAGFKDSDAQVGISQKNSTLTVKNVAADDFCIQGTSTADASIIVSYKKKADTWAKTAC